MRERVRYGVLLLFIVAYDASGQDVSPPPIETIQVTATRDEVPVIDTPASISVISGDELRLRDASDLRTALLGLSGVEISSGGDAGPAGSVPAIWGLREFDAFLLVVDDVPWGGAFNPLLVTLDLHDIERIEVLRGAAPVMYGATSFVGVIHVIHYPAGQSEKRLRVSGGGVAGSPGNVAVSGSNVLPDLGDWKQSISADIERQRYADEAAGMERGHVLYRLAGEMLGGNARVYVDVNALQQSPTSPYPRAGNGLDPTIDTDANHNPADSKLDETRVHVTFGYERTTGLGNRETTLALTKTEDDIGRGFLAAACGREALTPPNNACGFTQERDITDVYADTHVVSEVSDKLDAVWGVDLLYGRGEREAQVFPYAVDRIHGGNAPSISEALAGITETNELEDERTFLGIYGQVVWRPIQTLDVMVGMRLNRTEETREGEEDTPSGPVAAVDKREDSRPSGSVGLVWTAWSRGENSIGLFADYRDTFKPAAVDFGPEAEAEILNPETADSGEIGVKTRWLDGRLELEFSHFQMDMQNLVVPSSVNGTPGLANAGTLNFDGEEVELHWRTDGALSFRAAYAHHDLIFDDYVRDFDGVPTQLRGKYQELAPERTGSVGLLFAPKSGLQATLSYAYTGTRFLNKRNTSVAAAFEVVDASIGYRFGRYEVLFAGYNISDSRDPISESELGDGQYYRMPARSFALTLTLDL